MAALAATAGADVVATNDRQLRRQLQHLDPPVSALTADEFAVRLIDQRRETMHEVLDAMVTTRRRRPLSRDGLTAQLAGTFPNFVSSLDDSPAAPDEDS